MISLVSLRADGKADEKITYAFDRNGNRTEEIIYDSVGKIAGQTLYRYDEQNNQIGLKSYQPAKGTSVILSWLYEYDKTGNWISRKRIINGNTNEVIQREIEYY